MLLRGIFIVYLDDNDFKISTYQPCSHLYLKRIALLPSSLRVHLFFTFSSSHSAAVTVQFKEPSHHLDCPVPDRRPRTSWNIAAFARIRFQPVLRQGPSGLRAAEHSFIRHAFKLRLSQPELIILGQFCNTKWGLEYQTRLKFQCLPNAFEVPMFSLCSVFQWHSA